MSAYKIAVERRKGNFKPFKNTIFQVKQCCFESLKTALLQVIFMSKKIYLREKKYLLS